MQPLCRCQYWYNWSMHWRMRQLPLLMEKGKLHISSGPILSAPAGTTASSSEPPSGTVISIKKWKAPPLNQYIIPVLCQARTIFLLFLPILLPFLSNIQCYLYVFFYDIIYLLLSFTLVYICLLCSGTFEPFTQGSYPWLITLYPGLCPWLIAYWSWLIE